MAPTKFTRKVSKVVPSGTNILPLGRKASAKRTAQNIQDQNMLSVEGGVQTRGKRKAEHSPVKNDKIKRSALGNLTNNAKMTTNAELAHDEIKQNAKKENEMNLNMIQTQVLKELQNVCVRNAPTTRQQAKITTRSTTKNALNLQILKEEEHTIDNIEDANTTDTITIKIEHNENGAKKVSNSILPSAVGAMPLPPPAPTASAMPLMKVNQKPMRRISNEFEKTEESLYMSALEDISSCESMRLSGNFEAAKRRSALLLQQEQQEQLEKLQKLEIDNAKTENDELNYIDKFDKYKVQIPEDVDDFDKANWDDPFQVSHYAMDIFNYLREREADFLIIDYMEKQVHLSKGMRSLLVDWMVEVQETFELNHETLYLAVKIVDLFLCRVVISKDKLQLLGAAALFIACKYDERTPPLIEDFLYICDGAYKHDELIRMEMTTLQTINYDLGIPLSYRFLRRYARCSKVPMPTLTLARYILELSLMDYDTIRFSDSKLASACLFMALRLHGSHKPWDDTLEFYSGYKIFEFAAIVPILNAGMHRKTKGTIKTIRSKYSHKIFYEVAKVPLMTTEQLYENNFDVNDSIEKCIAVKEEKAKAKDKH